MTQAVAEQVQPTSLLNQRPFRMLSYTRFTSRVAQNSLNFGLVLLIVDETGKAFFSSLLVLALVVPATGSGIVAGALADSIPKRPLVLFGNTLRAVACFVFVMATASVASYYLVAVALAITSQFATAAEGAILPAIVKREELGRANALNNAIGGVAQILGFVILTPIVLRVFDSPDALFAIGGGLFALAGLQALFIGSTRGVGREDVGSTSDGPWWRVGWNQIRSDSQVMHAAVELTLISMAMIILGGLIPTYIQEVLDLPVEIGALVLMPAAIGVVAGLRTADFLAHRIPHAVLSTTGFIMFVVALGLVTFVNQEASFLGGYSIFSWLDSVKWGNFDGGGIIAMAIMLPLGFGFSLVMVSGQTVLNDRVPLGLQGRVLSTQGAMAALAASMPVLGAGALGDLIGVQPVMAMLAGAIGIAAVFNLRT
jgi:Na+/melibiose symporter-like transporter